MIALCRAFVALLVFVLVAAQPSAQAQNYNYGINTHNLDAMTGGKVTGLGTGWVRLDFNWNQIQPVRGGPYNWPWSSVLEARSRGLNIFATLAYAPGWANGGQAGRFPPTAANMQYWTAFCTAAAQTFAGDISHWGMWNEPDSTSFLAQPSRYQELATTCRNAIKAVNSSLKVLGPEVSTGGVNSGFYRTAMQTYGHQVFDIVTVHYYWGEDNKWVDSWMDTKVKPYRYNKHVWMTETGRNYSDSKGQANHHQGVLERFQPRRSWWTKVFPYDLYRPSPDCSDAIVAPNQTNRPAYYTIRDWILGHP